MTILIFYFIKTADLDVYALNYIKVRNLKNLLYL